MRAHLALDYANYIPESSMTLNIAIRQKKKKEIKDILIGKEVKLALFANDMIFLMKIKSEGIYRTTIRTNKWI